jgi:hypothetical protein
LTPLAANPTSLVARIPPRAWLLIVAAIIALQAVLLLAMGRLPMCVCGNIKLWYGATHSPENSQQIFDWYSFTHILHGFWLYLLGWLVLRRAPIAARLALAVFLEGAWEVLENSSFVIDRYRAGTVSLDYYGDSVVNSVGDTVAMMFGFALARFLPIWSIVVLDLLIEFTLGYFIHDNLLLNIVMLMYPLDSIKAWQLAAPLP